MNISKNEVKKFTRTFMREETYQALREWIVLGELELNIKLKNRKLSEMLGETSRTPIREALLKLEDEELVVIKANRWTLEQGMPLFTSKNGEELEELHKRFYEVDNKFQNKIIQMSSNKKRLNNRKPPLYKEHTHINY